MGQRFQGRHTCCGAVEFPVRSYGPRVAVQAMHKGARMAQLNTPHALGADLSGRCACCMPSGELANSPRRHAMRGLFAGLLLSQLPLAKADDLLDPTQVGAARKSIASEGLLDPGSLGGKAGQSSPSYAVRRSANRQPPSHARHMVGSVVSSMDSLTRAAADLVDDITKLDRAARELGSKLSTLRYEMAAKLEEYRLGLFCSGCGKTKSEILARGETFPHSGQTIIKPTPEQIAAKERELQAPIDRTDRELRNNRSTRASAVNERDEALLQISAGLKLWCTAITYENSLLQQDESESEVAYKVARKRAEDQIRKLRLEALPLKDADQQARLRREIDMWTSTQDRLDQQRSADRRAIQNALSRANAWAGDDSNTLNGFLVRGDLRQHIAEAATATFVSRAAGLNELGGMYRMGSYSASGHDNTLSSVTDFINNFRRSARHESVSPTDSAKAGSLPADTSAIPQLKGKLRDLLKCDPDAGEKCAPAKNGGSSVRG